MSEYKTLKFYLTQPNRHNNPYTVVFIDTNYDATCAGCADELFQQYPDDDQTYIEGTLQERFGEICISCLETLEPDCGYPTDFFEFVGKLEFQGFCLESAKAFAKEHIPEEYIIEQAVEKLFELMQPENTEFPDQVQEIAFLFDMGHEELEKVKAQYDEQDAINCLQS